MKQGQLPDCGIYVECGLLAGVESTAAFLGSPHFTVHASGCKKFLMSASFGNTSFSQYKDLVCVNDCAQSMSNCNCALSFTELL
mmetsp:Transcript_39023/g.95441  ORF Transcript_39023/g.95441 Transcript_39023/m.95441 type:complete len:84 (-) Transcript_39023:64-315(-)